MESSHSRKQINWALLLGLAAVETTQCRIANKYLEGIIFIYPAQKGKQKTVNLAEYLSSRQDSQSNNTVTEKNKQVGFIQKTTNFPGFCFSSGRSWKKHSVMFSWICRFPNLATLGTWVPTFSHCLTNEINTHGQTQQARPFQPIPAPFPSRKQDVD